MMTTNDPIHSDIDDNDARTVVICGVDDIIGIVSSILLPIPVHYEPQMQLS